MFVWVEPVQTGGVAVGDPLPGEAVTRRSPVTRVPFEIVTDIGGGVSPDGSFDPVAVSVVDEPGGGGPSDTWVSWSVSSQVNVEVTESMVRVSWFPFPS